MPSTHLYLGRTPEIRFTKRNGNEMLHVRWKNANDKGSEVNGTRL
jgi:hypothetical protein